MKNFDLKNKVFQISARSMRILVALTIIFGIGAASLRGGSIAKALGLASGFSDDNQPPSWLDSAQSADALATDRSYALLAGKLINLGLVDASECPGKGLTSNGAANPCGEIAAKPAVILWQNQFDQQILESAEHYNVPPYLLKNILAIESQFWPSRNMTIYGYYEYGLGHMTPMGADTLLHWNEPLYRKICTSVYTEKTCEKPYTWLGAEQQAALRGTVLRAVSGDCEHCPGGVNLIQAKTSIPVIAAALRANYDNVIWALDYYSKKPASSYNGSDIWKITTATYNAGIGCTTDAIRKAMMDDQLVSWKSVSASFTDGCEGARRYVEMASYVDTVEEENLIIASQDSSKAAKLVFESADYTATPAPTVEEPTATAEGTRVPVATITPFDLATATSDGTQQPATDNTPIIDETQLAPEITATPTLAVDEADTLEPAPTLEASPTLAETSTEAAPPTATEPAAMPTPTLETIIPTPDPDFTPIGETQGVMVKFRSFAPEFVENILIDLVSGDVTSRIDDLGITVLSVPAQDSKQVLKDLNSNVFVEYAEPDYVGKMMGLPNPSDGYFVDGHQPNLAALQVNSSAWNVSTGSGVVVAVIDTGLDASHTEFSARVWQNSNDAIDGLDNDSNGLIDDVNGWNYVDGNNSIGDTNGHGTHTAGVIAANADDSGMVGIAPNSTIMVLKVLDAAGYGHYSDLVTAIHYAVDEGANVIQIGFTGEYNSAALLAATNYAYDNGVTIVAAAGNTGTNDNFYPAANPNVIGVAALDTDNTSLATFSTYGDTVDFVAPGVGVLSTVPGSDYGGWSGTSVSSAEVTGIVALLYQKYSTPAEVYGALKDASKTLGSATSFGNGIPQAADSLGLSSVTSPTPEPTLASTPLPTPPGGVSLPMYVEFWAYNINSDTQAIEPKEQRWADNLAIVSSIGDTVIKNAIGPGFPDPEEGFDGQWAEITGYFASDGYWLIPEFATAKGSFTTKMSALEKVVIKPRFYFGTGYVDDEFKAQVSVDGGSAWTTLETFNASLTPPFDSATDPMVYDISSIVTTTAKLNDLQFRLLASAQNGGTADNFTIYFDQVKIEATANELPSVSITGPIDSATFMKTDNLTFTAKFFDMEDGSTTVGSDVVWRSDVDGLLGTGLTLSNISNLTPGTHSITVSVKDSDGQTGVSAPLTITITSGTGPHGGFTSATDGCALCHRAHTAQSPNELLAFEASSYESNAFCESCHGAGKSATTVVTHSNLNYSQKQEGDFELLCVQCHDPHGNSGNLFMIRKYLYYGSLPTTLDGMTRSITTVDFNQLKGSGSFDDSGTSTDICVACHVGSMVNHEGGSGHAGLPVATGTPEPLDYTGQSCITCHKHSYSIEIEVSGTPVVYPNGFMAATPTPTP